MIPYWRLSAYYFFYFAFVGAFSPYFTLYLQSIALLGHRHRAADVADAVDARAGAQPVGLAGGTAWGMRIAIVRLSALASLAGFSVFFLTTEFAGFFSPRWR
jgi:PPP family 3-phenylpropionic acid transporter